MMNKKRQYIRSPINYQGRKFKLLPQIIPILESQKIDTFYDLCVGSGDVVINVKANKKIASDINWKLINILDFIQSMDEKDIIEMIEHTICLFSLNKKNSRTYLLYRQWLNLNTDLKYYPIYLFTLMCHSFNNIMRFNQKGSFNVPFGKRTFNNDTKQYLKDFKKTLRLKEVHFMKADMFQVLKFQQFNESDLIYIDPPYLNSVASYNENNGWTESDEVKLLKYLDALTVNEVRWALSNNFQINPDLERWALIRDVKIHYLEHSYKNANHQKKCKEPDREVLITNW